MSKKPLNCEQIVEQYLRRHGYDGLACEEQACCCSLGGLMPCNCCDLTGCLPGHIVMPDGADDAWRIEVDK